MKLSGNDVVSRPGVYFMYSGGLKSVGICSEEGGRGGGLCLSLDANIFRALRVHQNLVVPLSEILNTALVYRIEMEP